MLAIDDVADTVARDWEVTVNLLLAMKISIPGLTTCMLRIPYCCYKVLEMV